MKKTAAVTIAFVALLLTILFQAAAQTAGAIEQNRFYKREMIEFVRGRFPELSGVDDTQVLAFLKRRSV